MASNENPRVSTTAIFNFQLRLALVRSFPMKSNIPRPRHFASDNYAGICPEAMAALIESNRDHACSYGTDPWTVKACELIRDVFETDCETFFVFSGTAA